MGVVRNGVLLGLLALGTAVGCTQTVERSADGLPCVMPNEPTTILEHNGAVLQTWAFRLEEVFTSTALPDDFAFKAYRAAIERDGADVVRPVSDAPVARTESEVRLWEDERFNNDLAFNGDIGSIGPISCLDALLFAHQANRISQVDHPTEFLASVLRRETEGGFDLFIVFGAGLEMFPPKEVYGFDVVDRYLADGWSYWYALHNHTIQKNGTLLALGVPVPSTSDIQLVRGLAEGMGLESVRVTNGFYTFNARVEELGEFRTR